MQNKKQEQLLSILSEQEDQMTSRQLADLLQVPDRTIRFSVKPINKRITPAPIESNVHQGYRVMEGVQDCLPEADKQDHKSDVPQTPGARCVYTVQKLLSDTKELNLVFLQNQIFVSGYPIDSDLKRIRKMLEPYSNLKLVRSREYIPLKGDGASKRRSYRDLLVAEIQENLLNMNLLAGLYKNFDLLAVKDVSMDVLEGYGYSIHESMFPMAVLHTGTSLEHMNCSNYVNMENGNQGLKDTIEYQISQAFLDRMFKRLHIAVRDKRVGMFVLVVMGKRASSYTSDFINFEGKWLNTKKLITEALEGIYSLFGLDFREDGDLIAGPKMHIHGLIDRVKVEAHTQDAFVEEIKRRYPLIFDMGIYVVEQLEEKLGTPISEVGSYYIALCLGAASERIDSTGRYRTIMIIPHNRLFSDMRAKRISEMPQERMEVVGIFRYFEEETASSLDPDLILTTSPLEHKLDVPTIPINLFVDSETESSILQAISKLGKERFQLEFTSHIGDLICEEHSHENVTLETSEEITCLLCRGLGREDVMEPDSKDIALRRRQMSSTSFVNAFVVPHVFGAFASNSTIAVTQLRGMVRWGNFDVGLVVLFAVNEGNKRMIRISLDQVNSVVNHPEELAKLVSSCTYEEFIDRITG